MYIVHFLGLVYFLDRGREGKLVLMPDGSNPGGRVPKHFVNFFICDSDIVSESVHWDGNEPVGHNLQVTRFPIRKPSQVTISGMEIAGNTGCLPFGSGLNAGGHTKLPELKRIDPRLEIVPEWAQTMAQMWLRQGMLQSFLFGTEVTGAGVSTLRVSDHSEPITILARAGDGSGFKSVQVKEATEIVFSNTADLLSSSPGRLAEEYEEDTHFRLYGRLDINRREDRLTHPPPPPKLKKLQTNHPYLKHIDPGDVGDPGCSNSCC